MRGMVAIALGPALFAPACAASRPPASAPEPVVVVVGEPTQQTPVPGATETKGPERAAAEPKAPKQAAADKDRARKAGILGALSGAPQLQAPFGSGAGALGGLTGSGVGDAFGVGGLGLSGQGSSPWSVSGRGQGGIAGGGGTGQGIGLGGLGTLGHGTAGGSGLGAIGALRATYPDTVQVRGNGLSVDAVQTVGRSHKSEIDECFRIERERSGARGGITIACTVGPAGAVTRVVVADSTLPGVDLAYCIAQAVGAWKFPAPSTGAAVTILLPFRF